jgi:hypothetical protein
MEIERSTLAGRDLEGLTVFNSTTLAIEALTHRLVTEYRHVYDHREPDHAPAIAATVRLALERIGMSDALYHDVDHTMTVTLLGTAILRGRSLAERVTPDDWLHMTVALLCHAVGQVRGACRGDTATEAVVSPSGERRPIPRGASDAWLAPFRIDRGKIFVHERVDVIPGIDPDRVARAIELTRFPMPEDEDDRETGGEAGLVRAAVLMNHLALPDGLRKQTALFYELTEAGVAARLGLTSPADFDDRYVAFFWEKVEPYISGALRYLALTQEGRQYIANLHAQVFTVEYHRWRMGPQPGGTTQPAPPA